MRAPAPDGSSPRRSREEPAHAVTHGMGAVASLAAGAVLIVMAAVGGDAWQMVGVSVFATTLIALYTASTLYHAPRDPGGRARLKVVDHDEVARAPRRGTDDPAPRCGDADLAGSGRHRLYRRDTLLSRRPGSFAHAFWHLLVIAGSVCHSAAMGTLL